MAVLLVAALLRLYQLGFESLWLDEAISVMFAELGVPEIVGVSRWDNNYPTYYLMLHYWMALFGKSEFAVRLLSALIGVLAVYAMYAVGTRLFGGGVGLLAALILAVSPYHVAYSQEARVYNLMALLALVSFYFFLRLREEELDRRVQAGYVLSTAALAYSHGYALFILIAQNAYVATVLFAKGFGRARPGLKRWVALQALLALLFVPGLLLLIGWLPGQHNRAWLEAPTLGSIQGALTSYAGSTQLLVLLLTFCALAVVALLREGRENLYLLIFWFLTPLALPLLFSAVSTPIFGHRFGIAATLPLYLLAARGVEAAVALVRGIAPSGATRSGAATATTFVAVLMLVALSAGELWRYFSVVDKDQWREAVGYVNREAEPGDLVVVAPGVLQLSAYGYYSTRDDLDIERYDVTRPEAVDEVFRSVWEHERVWVIVRPQQVRPGIVKQAVTAGLLGEKRAYHERYRNVDLTLYENRARR